MDPMAVLAYGAEQALPLIGMEWKWCSFDVQCFTVLVNAC